MTNRGQCIDSLAHGGGRFFRFVASVLTHFGAETVSRKSQAIRAPRQRFKPVRRGAGDSTERSPVRPLFRMIHEGTMSSRVALRAEKRTKRLMGAPREALIP